MALTNNYLGLHELYAVQHFVDHLQSQNKPFKAHDAHCLLVHAPTLKEFLQSQYKLSDLQKFFRKYPRYFKVDTDDTVLLNNPDLKPDELKCVSFFLGLLTTRENRAFDVICAFNFVNIPDVQQFLRTNYAVNDLSPFFENHSDFFVLKSGSVLLKGYWTLQTSSKKTMPNETSELAASRKIYKKMNKKAVEFYVDLIQKRGHINAKLAHSFLGDNSELRDFLKTNYSLNNLGCFFEVHPNHFLLKGEVVGLAPVSAINKTLFRKVAARNMQTTELKSSDQGEEIEQKVVNFYLNIIKRNGEVSISQAHSFIQNNIEIRKYLKEHYEIGNLGPFFTKHSNLFSVRGKFVSLASVSTKSELLLSTGSAKPSEPKLLELNLQGLSNRRNSNASTSSTTSNAPSVSSTSANACKQKMDSNNIISDNRNMTNLLSLVMSFSSENTNERTTSKSVNECRKVQDASCQTLSTGPILSLNVMCEFQQD